MKSQIKSVIHDQVSMMRISLNKGWDYVWVAYDDKRGFISITSSFGAFSFIWNAMGTDSLKQFFTMADKYYLAGKLFSDRHSERKSFEAAVAIKRMKEELLNDRKACLLGPDEARQIFDEILGLEYEVDSTVSADLFYSSFSSCQKLSDWFNETMIDSTVGFVESPAYLFLQDEIIPLIQAEFKKLLEDPKVQKTSVG